MTSKNSEQADTATPVDELAYEAAYQELEETVAALETEERTLEEALALYERGQALAQRCAELLDTAELQVREHLE
ncbi:MAG: exodeoxyribonuclease VII small subunit [Anaerolineales bacterium]|nr:exodeoxyribonuclease VII small subunit [Anaerolineales bacterium]